jgi:hypothetical protein
MTAAEFTTALDKAVPGTVIEYAATTHLDDHEHTDIAKAARDAFLAGRVELARKRVSAPSNGKPGLFSYLAIVRKEVAPRALRSWDVGRHG